MHRLPAFARTLAGAALLSAACAGAQQLATPYIFTTYAGTATAGSMDGVAAGFNAPQALVLDAEGDLFVSDSGNAEVRLVSPNGYVSTMAGNPVQRGLVDGQGAAASLNQPAGIAFYAPANALYVADTDESDVRLVNLSGAVSQFAGNPTTPGTADGTGTLAGMENVYGIAAGPDGTVYFTCDNEVRRISQSGVVTPFAGNAASVGNCDGAGAVASFNSPKGLAVDGAGNVYVADFGNDTIREISPSGTVSTLAGIPGQPGLTDGTAAGARFSGPMGVAVDPSGSVYVADTFNNAVRRISNGVVTTLGGGGAPVLVNAAGLEAGFNSPRGIAVDANGMVYVADTLDNCIRKGFPSGSPPSYLLPTGVAPPVYSLGAPHVPLPSSDPWVGRQPASVAGLNGQFAEFSALAGGTPPFTYQWKFNGAPIPNAHLASVGVTVTPAAVGSYSVVITGAGGPVESDGAVLTLAAPGGPQFGEQEPAPQTMGGGGSAVFSVQAAAASETYQWYQNGLPLPGAVGDMYMVFIGDVADAGEYTCVATNPEGSAQSIPALLTVTSGLDDSRVVDISTSSLVDNASGGVIAGFSATGAPGASLPVLIRASGPALAQFAVQGAIPDPHLELFNSAQSVVAQNSGWAGSASIAAEAAQVGAFSWGDTATPDAAIAATVPLGIQTAQVTSASGQTGVALLEVYDAAPASQRGPFSPQLANLSTRGFVGTGPGIMEAGFVIAGSTEKTVLVRASGPALAAFGLKGLLPDPRLSLFSGGTPVGFSQGWGADPAIATAAAWAGAFAWTDSATADSAILVSLPPGAYTAEVSGASGDTGVVLLEIYAFP
ncbi:MAG TPA: hypothetical protein VGG34_00515 [Opitutaceae bacterium]